MPRPRIFCSRSLALLWLLGCTPGLGQQADIAAIAGTYHGQVFNGGDMDPVTTIFTVGSDGRLVGKYSADDESGVVQGVVSNPIFEGPRTVSLEWTDKYGEGYVLLEFSADFRRFDGYWGNHDSEAQNPWSGVKQ